MVSVDQRGLCAMDSVEAQAHTDQSPLATPDPFPYGWRYVRRVLPSGETGIVTVALTLEDVLHPQEGDQVTHSDIHQQIVNYLYNVFLALVASHPGSVVLNDVRIAWDHPEVKPHGPDLAVIFDVAERKNWNTFDCTIEGVRPTIIVEVTSPETRNIDLVDKLDEYDLVGVPIYIIIDSVRRKNQVVRRILGYQQVGMAYEPIALDEQGRLWIAPLQIWLSLTNQGVVCYNQQNQPIEDYVQAQQALTLATRRVQELEAELARLRADRE
jgi:Uma2 family endonuclease